MQAHRVELEKIEVDVGQVIDDALQIVCREAGNSYQKVILQENKGIELICDLDEQVPSKIVGDPNRLRHILHNLLG